jgi:hypothetical protein
MRTGSMIFATLFLSVVLVPTAKADLCTMPSNLVANCGFETGDFSSWTLTGNDVPGGLTNLYGVEGNDIFPLPGGTNPNSGLSQAFFDDQFADPTTLSQSIATTPGTQYAIAFYMAQELLGPGTVHNSLLLTFGGTTLTALTNVPAEGYTLFTTVGTATGASTQLSLTLGNDIGEFLIDDISVISTQTPEPATGLMILTAGAAAAGLYRRRRAALAAC